MRHLHIQQMRVVVFQTDNRPCMNFVQLTQAVNGYACQLLGYEYVFELLDVAKHPHLYPASHKIYVVRDFLLNRSDLNEILVFLDSDAWIQHPLALQELLHKLHTNPSAHGCFSRDPYMTSNTYINSGSFVLKINSHTIQMYDALVQTIENDPSHWNKWPYDQFYISNWIFEHKSDFMIFKPDILNTPYGRVFRHNWCKNHRLFEDVMTILHNGFDTSEEIDLENNIDTHEFPNTVDYGPTYID